MQANGNDLSDSAAPVDAPADEPVSHGHIIDGVDWSKAVAPSHTKRLPAKDRVTPYLTDPEELAPWEEQFAKWLALQTTRVSADDEDLAVRMLYGRSISRHAIGKVKRKLEFRQVYQSAMAEVNELRLKTARTRAIRLLPLGVKTYSKAIRKLDEKLDDPAETMSAIRSAAGLLTPLLDRTLTKKTEITTHSTQVTVTLSAEQAAGMGAPIMVVEAEEVKAIPAATA